MIQNTVANAPTQVGRIVTCDAERIKRVSVTDDQPTTDFVEIGRKDIELVADRLELYVVLSHLAEACVQLDVRTARHVREEISKILANATRACALDIDQVLRANHGVLNIPRTPDDDEPLEYRRAVERWCREAHSVVADFGDAERFYKIAAAFGVPASGHRIRCAVERLSSFRQRNKPGIQELWVIMGRMYAEGHLSIAQAAQSLESDVSTVVRWFEDYGFDIHPQTQLLSDKQRNEIAEAMTLGYPSFDPSLSRRCTIASQRIEGIDARGHDLESGGEHDEQRAAIQ